MCRIGDIVLIYRYMDHGSAMMPHSFVVLDDQNGKIKGLDFDFIGLVMSSFKNEEQKKVIGCLHVEIFNLLIEFIEELSSRGIKFQQIIDNL